MKIRIQHRTLYRYPVPVWFGQHRLMLRPREGHDVQIEQSILEITPAHRVHWIRDVNDNSVAVVDFTESAAELMIYSDLVLNHFEVNPFDFYLEPTAETYPFVYDAETARQLSALTAPAFPNDAARVREWLGLFWQPGQILPTLALLQNITGHISRTFRYQIRFEEGVQTPTQTLGSLSGSCRDFATLFIEACRGLGFGARFVSGYILSGDATGLGASTHAWPEIYLPGGGWKGFDPTLGVLTTAQHVPVAVARHPENATPIAGAYTGNCSPLPAEVTVRVMDLQPSTPFAPLSFLPMQFTPQSA